MKFLLPFLALPLLAAGLDSKMLSLKIYPSTVKLSGAGSTQQFLAIANYSDGVERDVTSETAWTLSHPNLGKLAGARLSALAGGSLNLTARFQGKQAISRVEITNAPPRPFQFGRDIGGILTKRGCNSAACHGGVKGRGGLKLSANALYPKDDYEWITKGGIYQVLTTQVAGDRVPRVNIAQPEKSLLLTKPTGVEAHGGGKRFDIDSEDYRVLLQWVKNGTPYGEEGMGGSGIVAFEVWPSIATLPVQGVRRLLVTARFADGHSEDYTHQVLYASNESDIASVNAEGLVTAHKLGETAILVRAAGQVASAVAGVIGPPIPGYPAVSPANFIDTQVFAKLRQFNLIPSELSEDGEFLRRVCLDLTGTLPPPARTREFLASTDPRKREKLIDTLLASPEYNDYWTFRFSDVFRVAIFANGLMPKWSTGYSEWIRNNIETNRPYDQVARERLSAQGYSPATRHFIPYNQIGTPPDTMAEEVRVFFGRRLDCAQCHNHPYENWSQDQFWGMAAFFGRMFKMGSIVVDHPVNMDWSSKDVDGKIELLHPRTKSAVHPMYLDGSAAQVAADANPRKELARWMTAHPYFAEAAVNRLWGYFFARGIVDPVDDFRSTNPPTHPELLATLASDFRGNGYNLRRLMKTITTSRAYQLSHRPNNTNRADLTNYSHSVARAVDAEVLLDAVADVTGVPETFATSVTGGASAIGQAPAGTRAIHLKDPDMYFSRFLELYGRPSRGAIPERSGKPNLAQALHMLAGATYVDRLGQPNSRLARMLESGATDDRIFEEFYLASLMRLPGADEKAELKQILGQRQDRTAGLREFIWALISSREFAENH
ncbi:MAG: DUF1549 domain-containing protein [Acidobacteriia bacterium]|nr:DUF1549 domain-containing protein [Terriglobia bacterium]